MMNDCKPPVDPRTFFDVISCTDDIRDYAILICTFIDEWSRNHKVDTVKFAAKIAEMVKRKVEDNGNCK